MKPLITALVDTCNHERYIEQALVSVLEQGLSPSELEIVVVDDGSADRTPEIIQKFLPRVKYLREKNRGQASAFNAGFLEAHGQFVALQDCDDCWEKRTRPWGYPGRVIVEYLSQRNFVWFKLDDNGGLLPLENSRSEFNGNFVAVPRECLHEISHLYQQQTGRTSEPRRTMIAREQ